MTSNTKGVIDCRQIQIIICSVVLSETVLSHMMTWICVGIIGSGRDVLPQNKSKTVSFVSIYKYVLSDESDE
jgi:hypothetical protein